MENISSLLRYNFKQFVPPIACPSVHFIIMLFSPDVQVSEMAVSELPGNPNAVWTVKRNLDGKLLSFFHQRLANLVIDLNVCVLF